MIELNGKPEIEFPIIWNYRIMCNNTQQVREAISRILYSVGIEKFTEGNLSSSGKYITLKASREVHSFDQLHELPTLLGKIDGVRQVL
ncbi:MAG: HP0495 family protein [Lentisphaeria bacterium]